MSWLAALSLALAGMAPTGCSRAAEPAGTEAAHTASHAMPPAAAHDDHSTAAVQAESGGVATGRSGRSPQQIRAEAIEHISHYHSIALSPEQEQVKQEALSGLPAPCCNDYSAATCCCPCNLAKAVWGLSHHEIANKGAGVDEVRAAVQEWLDAANPKGFRGNACYTPGGCQRPFHQDGCGGMEESQL